MAFPILLWDASALVKRYTVETGSDVVNALFDGSRTTCGLTVTGYAEVYSILLRRFHGGAISARTFDGAIALLRNEVLLGPRVELISVADSAVFAGIELMRRHHINSSDSSILAAFSQYVHSSGAERPSTIVVAADRRLCRAAGAEGFHVANPEELSQDATADLLRGAL
jgi:predicted nucleic acid-binding protein